MLISSWVAGFGEEKAIGGLCFFVFSFIGDLTQRRSALFFSDNFTRFFVPRFAISMYGEYAAP
ncbi:hypothetical protein [Microcoleus sp. N3A4]|uniref:hypothetical protein n=1 Tax=Microcoleus sp. N3A4 TaxID=3055379 RepID=UPI002FD09AA4